MISWSIQKVLINSAKSSWLGSMKYMYQKLSGKTLFPECLHIAFPAYNRSKIRKLMLLRYTHCCQSTVTTAWMPSGLRHCEHFIFDLITNKQLISNFEDVLTFKFHHCIWQPAIHDGPFFNFDNLCTDADHDFEILDHIYRCILCMNMKSRTLR